MGQQLIKIFDRIRVRILYAKCIFGWLFWWFREGLNIFHCGFSTEMLVAIAIQGPSEWEKGKKMSQTEERAHNLYLSNRIILDLLSVQLWWLFFRGNVFFLAIWREVPSLCCEQNSTMEKQFRKGSLLKFYLIIQKIEVLCVYLSGLSSLFHVLV